MFTKTLNGCSWLKGYRKKKTATRSWMKYFDYLCLFKINDTGWCLRFFPFSYWESNWSLMSYKTLGQNFAAVMKTMWNSPLSELSFHLLPVITNNDLTRVQSSSLFFAKWIKMTRIISCVMNPVDQDIKRQTDFTYIKLLNDLY